MSRLGKACLAVMLAVVPAGCGGDELSSPRGPGAIAFDLETPHDNDGALVVMVSGGAVDSIAAAGGYHVYTAPASVGGMSALVTGVLGDGPLLTVYVPDVGQAAEYTAAVTQTAARSTYELRDPADYRLIRR